MAKNKSNSKDSASSSSRNNSASSKSSNGGSMKNSHAQVPDKGTSRSGPGGE